MRCCCEEVTATQTTRIVGLNRKTVNLHYGLFREVILKSSLRETTKETGVFEADESYFGSKRIRGKRGCWAAG